MEKVNIISQIIATLIPMIVGFIYYNPKVLGGVWMDANGFKLENMKAPKPILYVGALVLSALLGLFIHTNVTGPGQDTAPDGHSYHTFGHGFAHGMVISLFVVLPILGTMGIFEQKNLKWLLVNVGYWLVTLILMCGILSAWR
jgi:hypothetical protein